MNIIHVQPPSILPPEIQRRSDEIAREAEAVAGIAAVAARNPAALTPAEFNTLNALALKVAAKTTLLAQLMVGNPKPKTGESPDGGVTKVIETAAA